MRTMTHQIGSPKKNSIFRLSYRYGDHKTMANVWHSRKKSETISTPIEAATHIDISNGSIQNMFKYSHGKASYNLWLTLNVCSFCWNVCRSRSAVRTKTTQIPRISLIVRFELNKKKSVHWYDWPPNINELFVCLFVIYFVALSLWFNWFPASWLAACQRYFSPFHLFSRCFQKLHRQFQNWHEGDHDEFIWTKPRLRIWKSLFEWKYGIGSS